MILVLVTNANPSSQSSAPNLNLVILLAITRKMKAEVANIVMMVMAATNSGPRSWLSHGTALAQIVWVDRVASVQKRTLA